MNTKKNNIQLSTARTSLALRLILPTVIAVLFTLALVGGLGYKISEQIHNYQTIETLGNNLQLSHGAMEEGWKNTSGAALRTEETMKTYTAEVMQGRLNLLGFPPHSGVMIVDSYTGTVLQTYPRTETPLSASIVKKVTHNITDKLRTHPLEEGGFVSVLTFAPLGLHLIAFNREGFNQTQTAPLMRLALISTLGLTALLVVVLMFGLLTYSVTRPLKDMSKNITEILEEDNFHHQMPAHHGAKELQTLTIQFNTLLSFIEERDGALKAHNESLEELVEARTAELKSTQEKLVLQERLAAIGEFASSVAHELRNPLSSIKMGVDRISDLEAIQGNDRRRLVLIQKEVDRLSEMLKGILSFAAPSALKISTFPLNTVLDDLDAVFFALTKEENVVFKKPETYPSITLTGDVDKLKQSLINCVKNAAEAAPHESEITLSITVGERHCMVDIHNTGTPIAPDALNRLFEPFFTTKPEGTGLGLPTTKRLLNEMNGDISVKSSEKSGTVCTLKLPIAETA